MANKVKEEPKKISVITPTFNSSYMLEKTLESVLRQDYLNLEHIIADAGSSDNTVDLLQKYKIKYRQVGKNLIWISEKDNGIYDGVNKASEMSTGDFLLHMEDIFAYDHALTDMVEQLEKANADYVFGGLIYQLNGKIIRKWSGKPGNWELGFMMATPTLLYTRKVWEKHGPYSSDYVSENGQDASDYDFQIKLMKDKELKFISLPKPLVIYYAGGSSNNNFYYRWLCIKECQKVLRNNHARFPLFTNFCKTGIALFAYITAPRTIIELDEWMK